MRQKLKAALALALSVSMMLSSVPVNAQTTKEVTANITQKVEKLKGTENSEKRFVEGEAIILYNSSTQTKSFNNEGALGAGIEIEETYDFSDAGSAVKTKSTDAANDGFVVSRIKSDKYSTAELIKILEKRSDIKYAEPNYKTKVLSTNDAYSKYQWTLDNKGQNGGIEGLDVNADAPAMQNIVNEDEKVIALVDTGIDYTHEDLQDVVWNNPIDSKQLKGQHGYDFVNSDGDPLDDYGHGTHCSGIMAAGTDNEAGIAGVANADNIKIMGLKILDEEGYGDLTQAIGAYNYIYKAQQLGVNVVAVNNSWGASMDEELDSVSDIMLEVINMIGKAGAVSVCASGNEAVDNEAVSSIPGCLDSPYIISVAASNEKDELAAFSNYGNNVDIAAPGVDVLSTVSYNVFNPSIYENKDALCSVYEDFETGNLVQTIKGYKLNGVTAGEGDIAYGLNANGGKADMSVSMEDGTYFGDASDGTKSLQWNIEGASEGDMYTLYFPYEAQASETSLYSSVMTKVSGPAGAGEDFFGLDSSMIMIGDGQIDEKGTYDEDGEEILGGTSIDDGNYWTHFSGEAVYGSGESGKRAIAIYVIAGADGDYTVNIDNLGVSKPDVPAEAFGKYDFYNGTSMAAPHVTAAVAAVANSFEDETALERKARIVGSARKSEALYGMVSSGGTLDFSNMENPGMSLETAMMNDKNQIEISGYYLENAEVLINGELVAPISHTNNLIVVDGKNYLNTSIFVEVIKDEDYAFGSYFFASGKAFDKYTGIMGYLDGGSVVSGGECLYYVDCDGYVYVGTPVEYEDEKYMDWEEYDNSYSTEIFGEEYKTAVNYTMTSDTDIVCVDKTLYTVLSIDVGFAEESVLARYDEKKGWQKYADVPEDFANLTGSTLTSYNGKLYLIGGLNEENGIMSKQVKCYDAAKKEWTQAMILPEGRCFAKAMQVGTKLVVTLGGTDTGEVPKALIFDGNEWKVSKAQLGSVMNLNTYLYQTDEEFYDIYYADAQTGLIKNGIVFTNLKVDGLGDTFTYDIVNDKYVSTGYCLNADALDGDQLFATTVKDKLYVLYGWGLENEDFDFDYWKKNAKASDYYSNLEDDIYGDIDMEEMCDISVCTMPVTSGYIYVNDKSSMDAYVDGAGYYLPGDTIKLTAEAYEGFYVKSFTVDGKKINADSKGKYTYTTKAAGNAYTINVSTESGANITDIFLDTDYITLEKSTNKKLNSYQLYAEVFPDNADGKIVWTSSNTNVATVNSNGKVSIAKNAKVGQEAVIRATAANNGKVYAECTVVIVKASIKKGSKVKAGKFTYKVTNFSAKKNTVSVVSLNNKKASKAAVPATVKINGIKFYVTAIGAKAFKNCKKLKRVTIGKNVTSIGKNAFKGCKKLKKVTIKSAKIKTFGKGLFKGTSKKLTVKVPKKLKKNYRTKLKKAGYKGKVK